MKKYERIDIEIVKLSSADIVTSSPFNGKDDEITGW